MLSVPNIIDFINDFSGNAGEEKKNLAQQFLEENSENNELGIALVSLVLDSSIDFNYRFLGICAMNISTINIPKETIYSLFPLLAEQHDAFVFSLAQYISNIISEEELPILLDSSLECLRGVLYILRFLTTKYQQELPELIPSYALSVFDHSDDMWSLSLASAILSSITEPSEEMLAKATEVFSNVALSAENFPLFIELFNCFKRQNDSEEMISIIIQKLHEINELVPFGDPLIAPDGTSYHLSLLAFQLVDVLTSSFNNVYPIDFLDDGNEEESDQANQENAAMKLELFPLLVNLCRHTEREETLLNEDIETFIIFYDYMQMYQQETLRTEVVNFYFGYTDYFEVAMQLIEENPELQEPIYYLIGLEIVPFDFMKGTFTIEEIETDDILTFCAYLMIVAKIGQLQTEELFSLFESDDFHIIITASRCVLMQEDYKECAPVALEKLFSLIGSFETSIIVDLMDIMFALFEKIENDNAEIAKEILEQCVSIIDSFWADVYVHEHMIPCLIHMTEQKSNFGPLFETFLPVIENCLQYEETLIIGIVYFGVIFASLPCSDVEIPDVSSFFPVFHKFYMEFDPNILTDGIEMKLLSYGIYLFTPMSFFIRMGMIENMDEKFMCEIFPIIEFENQVPIITQIGSVILSILQFSEEKLMIVNILIQYLKQLLENKKETTINSVSLITSCLGYIVTLNREETIGMLQSIDDAIPLLIESLRNSVEFMNGRFEFYLSLTLLFAICEDKEIPYSCLERFMQTILYEFSPEGENTSSVYKTYRFLPDDPLVSSHFFFTCTVYDFICLDFIFNEDTPDFLRKIISTKYIFFKNEPAVQSIPFFQKEE